MDGLLVERRKCKGVHRESGANLGGSLSLEPRSLSRGEMQRPWEDLFAPASGQPQREGTPEDLDDDEDIDDRPPPEVGPLIPPSF